MAAAQGSQAPSGGNAKTRTAPAPVGRRARPLGSVSCSVLKRVIENQSHMDYAMQNDQHRAGHDDLADIWNRAQHRRAEDIYWWLAHFLERHRQPESGAEASLQSIETASATNRTG